MLSFICSLSLPFLLPLPLSLPFFLPLSPSTPSLSLSSLSFSFYLAPLLLSLPLFPFPFKTQSRTGTFLVIPLQNHPLRHRQKYVSQMILNLVDLTMKIESHSDSYYVCDIILSILCILTYCRLTVAFINTLSCIRQHYGMQHLSAKLTWLMGS